MSTRLRHRSEGWCLVQFRITKMSVVMGNVCSTHGSLLGVETDDDSCLYLQPEYIQWVRGVHVDGVHITFQMPPSLPIAIGKKDDHRSRCSWLRHRLHWQQQVPQLIGPWHQRTRLAIGLDWNSTKQGVIQSGGLSMFAEPWRKCGCQCIQPEASQWLKPHLLWWLSPMPADNLPHQGD